jgi:hypothetical protein
MVCLVSRLVLMVIFTDGNLNEMFKDVSFFTDMSDQIYANGTPFNYFISQKNSS